ARTTVQEMADSTSRIAPVSAPPHSTRPVCAPRRRPTGALVTTSPDPQRSARADVAGPREPLRAVARWALGLFLAGTGTAHLTVGREEFLAQVPSWVPVDADVVVVVSGVAEVALGVALLVTRRHRHLVGWATAGFFVAIFPGNVAQYLEGTDG